MAFEHGKGTVVIGDEIALTGFFTQSNIAGSNQLVDVTTFGNDDEVLLPGSAKGTLSLTGLFDSDANASDAEMYEALGAASGKVVTVGFGGLTIGNRAVMVQGKIKSRNIQSPANDAVRLSAIFDGDGAVRGGVSLHDLEAETAAADFASVDEAASTLFGAIGHLHVTAFTGTDLIVKIQDSANDSTWADLITFTTATGVTQQRASSAVGTVDRYVRAIISGGTFTTATLVVALARHYR